MSETQPPRYDSRQWTGDIASQDAGPQPLHVPRRRTTFDAEHVRSVGVTALFLFVLFATDWLVQRTPGAVAPAFAVTVPAHYGRLMTWLDLGVVAAIGLLLISFKRPLPSLFRWFLLLLAAAVAVVGFVECRLVAVARSHAVVLGPSHPMLLASTDDCGRNPSKRRSPGPCVHSFNLWDRSSGYAVTGYGRARVRACVNVQRIGDRTGFTWDEVVTEQDLIAETDDDADITDQVQRECVDGSLYR
ncbi:MAG: hypothetical protein ABW192_01365 [Sphingobium sp.]